MTGGKKTLSYALSNIFKYSKLLSENSTRRRGNHDSHASLHIIAGAFILASLALAHYVSPKWLWFTAFVGANLFQSGFTNWCLLATILKKAGLKEA